jgi:hypothetical protein
MYVIISQDIINHKKSEGIMRSGTQVREDQADPTPKESLLFYLPGTALLNPSYDTGISRVLAQASKFLAFKSLPELFTRGTAFELIDFDDPRLPSACKNFKTYYEAATKSNKDCFYVQWSADLGQTAWVNTARQLIDQIKEKLKTLAPGHELEIHMIAHSHGGQIARLVAEAFKDDRRLKFRVTTIETPLSIIPPTLMPDNVTTWQHFYHRDDTPMRMGSFFMQCEKLLRDNNLLTSADTLIGFISFFDQWLSSQYVRRIEDVFDREYLVQTVTGADPIEQYYKKELPSGWRSHELTQASIKDKHNDPVKIPEVAKFICDTVLPAVDLMPHPAREPLRSPKM